MFQQIYEIATKFYKKNNNTVLEQNDVLESFQFSNSEKLEIGSMVDLSYESFGGQGDVEVSYSVKQGSGNMDFDPIAIVESELRLANML
ncbi:28478_t:CDS:2 [Dentiscutata erythropus]|uniref:28478_t:CDS:1 n=1 Tax=Dentiscutata erythropus TaxID=1348616 RepID=A0A9N8ZG38_9GLOM|nr:28478_t:CDS:2 [Dentiscutata erythropus]